MEVSYEILKCFHVLKVHEMLPLFLSW